MRLRLKILLLAILPVLVALAATTWSMARQGMALAREQQAIVEQAWLSSKESELQHYVRLAYSVIEPLAQRNDEQARIQALDLLARMDFGPDGYFFVYDERGVNLMHPRQPELVGQNLFDFQDDSGQKPIRLLLEVAREGGRNGKPVRYLWPKPSAGGQVAEKLGFVASLEAWGWMFGTGIYLDDVEVALAQVDATAQDSIHAMQRQAIAIACLAILLVTGCALALNISDHRHADARLRQLARKVVYSQEEERARLSRELHDGLSQMLVSVKLMVETAQDSLARHQQVCLAPGHSLDEPLARALERLHQSLAELRRMSHNLRPALLDDLGLPAALRHLAAECSPEGENPAALQVNVSESGQAVPLPEAYATTLFRVAQEGLTNIVRHARATRASLILCYAPDGVELVFQDNGTGFGGGSSESEGGIGLRNMRERVEMLGGRLRLDDAQAHGALLRAWLPLPARSPDFSSTVSA